MKTKLTNFTLPVLILGLAVACDGVGQTGNKTNSDKSKSAFSSTDTVQLLRKFYKKKPFGTLNKNFQNLMQLTLVNAADTLDIFDGNPSRVKYNNGKREVEEAYDKIHLNGKAIRLLATEIDASAIISMESVARSLNGCSGNCQDTLLGLRVIYGQESDTLFLYYQPVLLCATTGTLAMPNGVGKGFRLCAEGESYLYEDNQFKSITNANDKQLMNNRIALYRTPVSAQTSYGVEVMDVDGSWIPFNNTNDDNPAGSAKSMVFPIDQLKEVSLLTGSTGRVRLWNVIVTTRYYYDLSNRNIFSDHPKHEFLLSSDNVTYNNHSITGGTEFSNMSHICPPRCDAFTFYIK